jgi:glutamyl-tRNA reductase
MRAGAGAAPPARQCGLRRGHRGLDFELLQRNAQVYRLMRFQLIGVNHKTAPVEVRERLAIPESRLPEACKRLSEHPAVAEGMIVSTCNRVEFIANMKNGTGDLREFLREYFEIDLSQFESHLYEFKRR